MNELVQRHIKASSGSSRVRQGTIDIDSFPIEEKSRRIAQHIDFRIDAGYTIGSVLEYLTRENLRFVGRLKTNPRLEALAAEHIIRPVGRPPAGGYEYTVGLGKYQADSWEHSQRFQLFVLKVGGEIIKHSRRAMLRIAVPGSATLVAFD